MGFFNYIENFFFISLGVLFILVLLLVYHFKQRMTSVEKKGDTMYELMSSMVNEIRWLKGFYAEDPVVPIECPVKSTPEVEVEVSETVPLEKAIVEPQHMSYGFPPGKIVVSDDSDTESSGSGLDSDSDSDDESIPELQRVDSNDIPIVDKENPINENIIPSISDLEIEISVLDDLVAVRSEDVPSSSMMDLGENVQEVAELAEIEVVDENAVSEPEVSVPKKYTVEELRKMNISQLKALAIQSGTSIDTSKCKKHELITIITSGDSK
jgi:hypothetical protein